MRTMPDGLSPSEVDRRLQFGNFFGDIPVNGQVTAGMLIEGTIKESKSTITLSGQNMGFRELQLGSLSLQAEGQLLQETPGKVKSLQFTINKMTQTNNSGTLELLAPAPGTWQQNKFSLDADLQVDGQSEVAIGIKKNPGKAIALKIITRSLDSDGWLGNFIDTRYFFRGADIEAVLKGLPYSTQLMLSGTIREAGDTGVPFPLSGSFTLHYSPRGIEVTEFTWKSLERNQLTISGFLPYDPLAQEPFLDG